MLKPNFLFTTLTLQVIFVFWGPPTNIIPRRHALLQTRKYTAKTIVLKFDEQKKKRPKPMY